MLSVSSEVTATILQELRRAGPLARRAIAGRMMRGPYAVFRIDALRINNILRAMRVKGLIQDFRFPDYEDETGKRKHQGEVVYSINPLKDYQKREFERLMKDKGEFFAAKATHFPRKGHLEASGEQYAASLFSFMDSRFSKTHRIIPQKKTPAGAVDLFLSARRDDGLSFVVEVKNQVEPFHSGSDEFRKLMLKANALGGYPILLASFIARSGRALCEELGIAFLELHRQLIFTKKELGFAPMARLDTLKKVLHPDLFEPIAYERPFKNGLSKYVEDDFKRINENRWLKTAAQRWNQTWRVVDRILPENSSREWGGKHGVRNGIFRALKANDPGDEPEA